MYLTIITAGPNLHIQRKTKHADIGLSVSVEYYPIPFSAALVLTPKAD